MNSEGKIILNGIEETVNNNANINLEEKYDMIEGINTIKIFAASNNVLKPYEYSKSFIIISENKEIPEVKIMSDIKEAQADYWYGLLIIPILIGIVVIAIRKSRFSANNK